MKAERPVQKQLTIIQGKAIEEILRRAVHHALLEHKRAGNTIASWKDGQVVLIPAEQIHVENSADTTHL